MIKELIDSFTMSDEKFINNEYVVNFDVNFNKKNTLLFFRKNNTILYKHKFEEFRDFALHVFYLSDIPNWE